MDIASPVTPAASSCCCPEAQQLGKQDPESAAAKAMVNHAITGNMRSSGRKFLWNQQAFILGDLFNASKYSLDI
jgi:hypothetical protein